IISTVLVPNQPPPKVPMTRVATVQAYRIECHRQPPPHASYEVSKTFVPFSSITEKMLPKLSVKAI
ncbi:hypothetical protein, partial [Segatella buccae]|uniref:hypothetical protein n=1 Tax=Segatella buccae TaxID=28126 RepID=UPI0019552D71